MANIAEAIERVKVQQARQLTERRVETRRQEAAQEQRKAEWQSFLDSCRLQGTQVLKDSSLTAILQEVQEQVFDGVGVITPVEQGQYGSGYKVDPRRDFSYQGARVALQTETPSHLVILRGVATVEVDHESKGIKPPRLKIECLTQPKPRGIWDRLRKPVWSNGSVDVLSQYSLKDAPDTKIREWENSNYTRETIASVLVKEGIV